MSVETKPGYGELSRAKDSMLALRTLAAIRAGARKFADDGEREQLRLWSGWGPLAPLFQPKTDSWAQIAGEAAELLDERDLSTGMQGTYNAFFTPEAVAAEMWSLLQRLGFSGGKVAELGCGAGAFMATAPDGTQVVGVERDPTSAAIAKLLNPRHEVINRPLEEVQLPSDFGAVIGNVPFGDVKIFDPSAPPKSDITQSVHLYFLWRALTALAPGGLAVLLTSRYTLDSLDDGWKKTIAALGDFVGAVRLPSGGLEGGTEAIADIVVFRRRMPGQPVGLAGQPWDVVTREAPGLDWSVPVNTYFVDRSHLVLGTMTKGKTTQYGLSLIVEPGAEPVADGVRRAAGHLVQDAGDMGLRWVAPVKPENFDAAAAQAVTSEGWLEGSYHLRGTSVFIVQDGRAHQIPAPGKELAALIGLRDAAEQLVEAEADHSRADTAVDVFRKRTAKLYRDYVHRYGFVRRGKKFSKGLDAETGVEEFGWRKPPMGGFRNDPGWALVSALELWDDEDEVGTPAPILSTRQNRPVDRPDHTADPVTALSWCLDRLGRVDLVYIGSLLNLPPQGDHTWLTGHLGELIYQEPGYENWLTAEEYLSGDVRDKLEAAETAAVVDPGRYLRNVDALKRVQPKWLGPGEIIAVLGTPWIGTKDIQRFCIDLFGFGAGAKVRHLKESNRWEVDPSGSRSSTAASETWGTGAVDGYKLIEQALNGKVPNVYFRTEAGSKKDDNATAEAVAMQQRIKERFREWVWEHTERSERLVQLYNTRYNCLANRAYDGAHITVDGLAADWVCKLYGHQKSFIARGVASPATLCAHPVGAGKTATMTCLAMKLGELGLVTKPMLVVPNHLIEQAVAAAMQMFPGKKILGASAETISASRRAFTARVATQHWDLIIVTHSAFDRMPVHPATQIAYLEDRAAALKSSLIEASEDGDAKGRSARNMANRLGDMEDDIEKLRGREAGRTMDEIEADMLKAKNRSKKGGVKDAAKKIDRLGAGDRQMLERRYRDAGCTFEQLGVSWIGIDEAHHYKNLAVPCYNEGFTISPSKRASHLDMILRWLSKRGSGRYASLFTGTPVSNTMLELFVMMQYLMPEHLDSIELGSADSWVAAFVEMVTKVGVTVDGSKFELQTRPARFVNAPELRVLFSVVADVRTSDELGIKRPTERHEVVTVQPTSKQAVFSHILVARASALKHIRHPEPGADNMLKVCNDGRWMATDPALVGIYDSEPGKLAAAAEKIIEVDRRFPGKVQLVFCDIGTPSDAKGAQTYGRLRRLLTEMGMPVDKVEFVHSAKSDMDKAAQFKRARQSKLRVLIGSTGKMGTGTNVQDNIIAMHHLDAPYTPASVEQRDGRGIRHGNRNEEVFNYRYVTARTFDAYLWQLLVRKLTFISQLMSGKLDRAIEDCATDQLLSFSAVQASATGQPLLMEREEVAAQVTALRTGQSAWRQKTARQRTQIPLVQEEITKFGAMQAAWAAIGAAEVPDMTPEATKELAEQLAAAMKNWRYQHEPVQVGGLQVTFGSWYSRTSDETHPELRVDAGGGWIADRLFSSYKGETVVKHLGDLVAKADEQEPHCGEVVERLQAELEEKRRLLAEPFDKAEELVGVQARLDQLDAELRKQAVGHDDADGKVEVEVESGSVKLTAEEEALLAEIEAGAGIDVDRTIIRQPRRIPAQPVAVDRSQSKHSGAEVDLPILAGEPEQVDVDAVLAEALSGMEDVFGQLEAEFEAAQQRMVDTMAMLEADFAADHHDREQEMADVLALLGA